MEIAVSVKNLTKKYKLYEDKWGPIKEVLTRKKLHKDFLALNNVSINFPKGETIGVLGKNGSGKSTLLKIITGIAEPTLGKVEVNGSLVFLDVSSGIDGELSGYDNIFMKGILLGYTKEEMMEKVDDIIEFSELGEFIYQPVKSYSSGMRSKLGFAISVNVDPDILIVDEALAVGDALFRAKCMNKMNEFKQKGKTIIFVSHDKNAVESFCTKAAWLHQGNLITYGDSKYVASLYNDFMSGKKDLESILSEIKFQHSIEKVSLLNTKDGLNISLDGYLYQLEENQPNEVYLYIRNERTGELITKQLTRKPYKDTLIPESIRDIAGFSVSVTEKEFPSFFTPDKFTFGVKFKNDAKQWVQFPLWAGKANIVMDEQGDSSKFEQSLNINNNKLELFIKNRDKLQQQVNKIWYEDNLLHIEGVAFVRGYETPDANYVSLSCLLTNLNTFEKSTLPVIVDKTEEITENQAFNPQGKNYNYSKYHIVVELDQLNAGIHEFMLGYKMNNFPNYELLSLVWASKKNQYPNEVYNFKDMEIKLITKTNYLTIEVREISQ